ncbi:hypothetical protein Tco_0896491 [Tanacetum coccineum]
MELESDSNSIRILKIPRTKRGLRVAVIHKASLDILRACSFSYLTYLCKEQINWRMMEEEVIQGVTRSVQAAGSLVIIFEEVLKVCWFSSSFLRMNDCVHEVAVMILVLCMIEEAIVLPVIVSRYVSAARAHIQINTARGIISTAEFIMQQDLMWRRRKSLLDAYDWAIC